jgi:acid phosphatase
MLGGDAPDDGSATAARLPFRGPSGHDVPVHPTVVRRGRRRPLRALPAVLLAAALAGCSSSGPSHPASAGATPPATGATAPGSASPAALPTPDHVVVVVFENKDEDQVQSSTDAPYFNALAAKGAAFTNWTAITHPSQPNYLALFSGSTQGVTDDHCLPAASLPGPDLGGELLAAGKTFVGYAEAMPGAGYTGCASGRYAAKHNPWKDFADVPPAVSQPFSAFPGDYSTLPTVAFVVPDMCDDMHDCPVATGDAWLKAHMSGYADWAAAHNSLLIVTWDEDDFTQANVIPTTIVGAHVTPGTYPEHASHYALLRTIEDMYHLAPTGAAAQTTALTGFWTTGS